MYGVKGLLDPESGIIVDELRAGGSVGLPGFGRFSTREWSAREGRDPRTGRRIAIAARRACVFTPRQALRSGMKDIVGA